METIIPCRNCDHPLKSGSCLGCNVFRLYEALQRGKLDWAKDEHNGIVEGKLEQPTLSPDDVRVKATLFGGDADGYADGFPVYSTFVCSACGEEFEVDDGQPPPFNYCPECGAKFYLVQGAGYTEKKSLNKEAN